MKINVRVKIFHLLLFGSCTPGPYLEPKTSKVKTKSKSPSPKTNKKKNVEGVVPPEAAMVVSKLRCPGAGSSPTERSSLKVTN